MDRHFLSVFADLGFSCQKKNELCYINTGETHSAEGTENFLLWQTKAVYEYISDNVTLEND